jgi:hypothetical protein
VGTGAVIGSEEGAAGSKAAWARARSWQGEGLLSVAMS